MAIAASPSSSALRFESTSKVPPEVVQALRVALQFSFALTVIHEAKDK